MIKMIIGTCIYDYWYFISIYLISIYLCKYFITIILLLLITTILLKWLYALP
jgi:hypothetical protein